MEEKELSAAEKRELTIRQKMQAGNMTRENAELVLIHQAEEDARQAKRKKGSKPAESEK